MSLIETVKDLNVPEELDLVSEELRELCDAEKFTALSTAFKAGFMRGSEEKGIISNYSSMDLEELSCSIKSIGLLIEGLTFMTAHEGVPSDRDMLIGAGGILSSNLHEIAEAIYHPGDVTDESDE